MTDRTWTPRTRTEIAARVAEDIPEGWYVNLGIGVPTLVADRVPEGREVIFHAENGILGIGPAPEPGALDRWLINAGKQHVTLLPGGAYFHHADSFSMIRGRHIDLCVLGAYEVSRDGDLANWARSETDTAPAVGGAMDLAIGARQVWVAMEHVTRDGRPRLVERCGYPLTSPACVRRIYTDLAVIDVTSRGFELRDMVEGMTFEALQARTGAPLLLPQPA
ncbi:3-oxoacid CoA-transferase subunit B [Frigidibacter sp. MR17.24]|uniref:3-oxoacid CoA-transferase subunit B n=1 Tax=Frigidibacter sp. MR17.24 TaxID=3127345 RepID=UPI003012CC3B